PNDAGITLDLIKHFAGKIPLLGVCLGHQAIAQAFGAKIIKASSPMHGKISPIFHDQKDIFKNIPSPFQATRYHSLIIDPNTLNQDFVISAHTPSNDDKTQEIMAIYHKKLPLHGVQFHPESIMSEHGHTLLNNFITTYQTEETDDK
ncbi:MAG: aminodeoxychorismate/anthranilate synthase component II, partial [Polynucleobacter sp.]|nr:aminodeoxychorismate/anthranilate synthase component II [Polynucleobacter sp.]